jgi:hypothetical protein
MLDEVIFVVRTDDEDDLKYLEELLPTVPEYKKYEAKGRGGRYKDAWDVVEKGTMYIKIDDDVVRRTTHADKVPFLSPAEADPSVLLRTSSSSKTTP